MRSSHATRIATLLLLTSFVNGCATTSGTPGTPPVAVQLPAPPTYMNSCTPSVAKTGDPPNEAFDKEHAAFKACSRQGAFARRWYLRLRIYYASLTKK